MSLLLCSLILGAPPLPSLRVGDELVYIGDVVEECTRRESPYRRASKLEVRFFVLATRDGSVDLAAMTLLKATDDAGIAKVAVEVTGAAKETARKAPAVRLDLLRLFRDGTLAILVPELAPPPLTLTESTKTISLAAIPLDAPNPFELGPLPNTLLTWTKKPAIVLDGAEVIEHAAEVASPTWQKPTLTDRPWRRTERVWISPADGIARVVWRRVERTDGPTPSFRIETRLDLQPGAPQRGEAFTRVSREIEFAWWFAAQGDAKRDALRAQIQRYCEDYPPTPYREAVEAVGRRLAK